MMEKKHLNFSLNEVYQNSEPYSIRNFILSGNIKYIPEFSPPNETFVFDEMIFALCLKGSAKIKVNFKEYEITENTILILFPGQMIKIYYYSEDYLAENLFVSFDYILNMSLPHDFGLLLAVGESPCHKISEECMQNLMEFHSFIVKQYNRADHIYRESIVKSLFYAMILECNSILKVNKSIQKVHQSTWQEKLSNRFMDLLMKHYREHRSVAFYADKLCLTSNYLSATIKKTTGQSILSWIHEVIIIQAKILLKSTDLTIVQISDDLNFPNPSFFGRLFKKHVGLTPLAYRERLMNEHSKGEMNVRGGGL